MQRYDAEAGGTPHFQKKIVQGGLLTHDHRSNKFDIDSFGRSIKAIIATTFTTMVVVSRCDERRGGIILHLCSLGSNLCMYSL